MLPPEDRMGVVQTTLSTILARLKLQEVPPCYVSHFSSLLHCVFFMEKMDKIDECLLDISPLDISAEMRENPVKPKKQLTIIIEMVSKAEPAVRENLVKPKKQLTISIDMAAKAEPAVGPNHFDGPTMAPGLDTKIDEDDEEEAEDAWIRFKEMLKNSRSAVRPTKLYRTSTRPGLDTIIEVKPEDEEDQTRFQQKVHKAEAAFRQSLYNSIYNISGLNTKIVEDDDCDEYWICEDKADTANLSRRGFTSWNKFRSLLCCVCPAK